jgi:hypothetical protein
VSGFDFLQVKGCIRNGVRLQGVYMSVKQARTRMGREDKRKDEDLKNIPAMQG